MIDWLRRNRNDGALLLVAVVLLVLIPGTSALPLIDRDEPRFASATHEMMERGEWVVPTFNGSERFDKPILTYWLMRMGFAVFGENELGARAHSILATLALVVWTWHTGKRWFGPKAGLAAGLCLATCLQIFLHGRLAVADMVMVLAVAVAQISMFELLLGRQRSSRSHHWWGLYLALGLGFLAKGPVCWLVPAMSLALHRWLMRPKPMEWSRLGLAPGMGVVLVIVASWGVPALWLTQGRFWETGIGEHVVTRGLERFNGRGFNPFFYLGTSVFSLFPWITLAPLAVWAARRNWTPRNASLVSWCAAPYVLFALYATQLPHYVLPGFPAYCLLLGQALAAGPDAVPVRWTRVAGGLLSVILAGSIVLMALMASAPLPIGADGLRPVVNSMLAVLGGLALLPLGWIFRTRVGWIGVLVLACGSSGVGRSLRLLSATLRLSEVWQRREHQKRFIGYRYAEPSIVHYSQRKWDFLDSMEGLMTSLKQPGPLVIVALLEEQKLGDILAGDTIRRCFGLRTTIPRSFREELKRAEFSRQKKGEAVWKTRDVSGLNLGRATWQTLRVFSRD